MTEASGGATPPPLSGDTSRSADGDPAYVLGDQVGFMLRQAHQRAARIFQERIGSINLTAPQFNVLELVREFGPQSQVELAGKAAMDAATTQGVLARLHDAGLIDRTPDPMDNRRRMVSLTRAGSDVLAACLGNAAAISADILLPLRPKECEAFLRLLRKLT